MGEDRECARFGSGADDLQLVKHKWKMRRLIPPVTYQGSKRRFAQQIVDLLPWKIGTPFYDLCCGSGAVSLELVSRGFPPSDVTMVDAGPWGEFWRLVGLGEYDVGALEREFAAIPGDLSMTQEALRRLASEPVERARVPYVFIVLQNGAFGGKAVALEKDRWRPSRGGGLTFRNGEYLHPRTAMQSAWNTPVADVLHRVEVIVKRMLGITGLRSDVRTVRMPLSATVYLDPPYEDCIGGYGAESEGWLPQCPAFVSEARAIGPIAVKLGARNGGSLNALGIASTRQEWLSAVNGARFSPPLYMDLFEGL